MKRFQCLFDIALLKSAFAGNKITVISALSSTLSVIWSLYINDSVRKIRAVCNNISADAF